MNENYIVKLRKIHRVNLLIWGSILFGIIVLAVIAIVFKNLNIVTEPVIYNLRQLDNLMLLITIFLLFFIFYLKRNYLTPIKIIEQAEKKDLNLEQGDAAELVNEFGKEAEKLAKALILMRRYYIFVWVTAELIVLLGFLEYILALYFKGFLIYVIVGMFSLAINFPLFSKIERCYLKLIGK